MARQNRMSIMAIRIIAAMPMPKRIICGRAQGWSEPPATEKSIRNPAQATAPSRRISAQLSASSFAAPCGVPLREVSSALMRGPGGATLPKRRALPGVGSRAVPRSRRVARADRR